MRTKTVIPPQRRWTQGLFGQIVDRFDLFDAHERPERGPMRQQFLTDTLGSIIPPRPPYQERLHRHLNRFERFSQLFAVERASPIAMPQPKYQLA